MKVVGDSAFGSRITGGNKLTMRVNVKDQIHVSITLLRK